ncbi:endolytic transglycosylase MltG [Candidatus Peribacteria bacterium]|nr:MAG: endolytic transglycosylase MltG [Candidatus Peribacteria bacterium]
MKTSRTIILGIAAIIILLMLRSCSSGDTEAVNILTVSKVATTEEIKEKILAQEYIKGHPFLGLAMTLHGGYDGIAPGGYRIADGMGSWAIASALTSEPALKWITIPEGLRKEQVADRLQETLGWSDATREAFLNTNIQKPYDLTDGFYFPDTYLIPTDEDPEQVAKRFINRFNDSFAPYVEKFKEANIKYDTAIKIASLIQREAGGKSDMPIIAGVLWNRLLIKMPLQIDATLQYARGDVGDGYWAPVKVADKKIDSPFNTYLNAGLPPSPIANPGLDAIDAVLNSADTECLYYIHDNDRQIHCAVTYEEHLGNVERYLK